jgi:hypothetical protein
MEWDLTDVECKKCGHVGLLSSGLCRKVGCGQKHQAIIMEFIPSKFPGELFEA